MVPLELFNVTSNVNGKGARSVDTMQTLLCGVLSASFSPIVAAPCTLNEQLFSSACHSLMRSCGSYSLKLVMS